MTVFRFRCWAALGLLGGLLLVPGTGCGQPRAQGRIDYAEWRLALAEEFNPRPDTVDLATRWTFYCPWSRAPGGGYENSYNTGEALLAGPGVLKMTMLRRPTPRRYQGRAIAYDAPMLVSRHAADSLAPPGCQPGPGFSYGLFEARVRQPRYASAPAFWLWGGAPDEIDVFEADAHAITNNFHLVAGGYWRPTRRQEQTSQCTFYNADPQANLSQEFHTYGMSWLPEGVVFYYDGLPIRTETRLHPAGCPMYVILNSLALTYSPAAADTMVVDYLRVYRPRRLAPPVAVLRPGGQAPQTELGWLPFEAAPDRPDQATYQAWELLHQPRRAPHRLQPLLADNHNPDPVLPLPLPLHGRWAPAWAQTHGNPELRVRPAPLPDSLHWAVHDLHGRALASGTAPATATWYPRWPTLPPGFYALHLRQGAATATQPVVVLSRPAGSNPTAEWQRPAPPPADF